jgi:hypothetical protein
VVVGFAGPSLAGGVSTLDGSDRALGGDEPTLVFPKEEVKKAPPGGTVQVDVVVKSDGGTGDIGVESISLVTDYDQDYLELRNVEPQAWLEGEGETEVHTETTTDEESGNVTVEQWRDPPKNGATGTKVFATLTFDVREDAPETNATVSFQDSSVQLIEEYSMYIYYTNATIVVDEDAQDPGKNLDLDDGNDDNSGAKDGEGDDTGSGESEDANSGESNEENDSESLFTGPVLLVALAGTAGVVVAGTLVWRRRQ